MRLRPFTHELPKSLLNVGKKTTIETQIDNYYSLKVKNINFIGDYKQLGINISKDYPKILSGVNEQRLSNCPIKINRKDIKSILLMDI